MNAKVVFADALEASAYTVMLVTMAGKEFAPNISRTEAGYEVVFVKPVPIEIHEAILAAIKHDQINNPKKWAETRANLGKRDATADVQ